MEKHIVSDSKVQHPKKAVSLKTNLILVVLGIVLFSGVSIALAQISQMMLAPDEVVSLSCDGEAIQIESYSRQRVNVICQTEEEDAAPVEPTPIPPVEPTATPPILPTTVPQSPVLGDYFVSPDGNDAHEGTFEEPFRTIQHAVKVAGVGDVVYVRDGVYTEIINIRNSGQPGDPITIAAYPGERPKIDGRYQLPEPPKSGWPVCNEYASPTLCMNYGPLVSIEGNYIVFAGFDIINSNGRGIRVWSYNSRPHHIEIRNNAIYENRASGIFILGADDVIVEGNEVWRNINFAPQDLSPSQITWPHAVIALESTNAVFRGNQVYQNWGEGIGAGTNSIGVVIEDNVIFDNKVQIYVHRAQDVMVQRNLVYCTGDPVFNRGGSPPPGIGVNNEEDFDGDLIVDNVDILNNIVTGCQVNFGLWSGTGIEKTGVNDLLFAHNTLVNAVANVDDSDEALGISVTGGPHTGIEIRNNVVLQSTGRIAYIGGGGADVVMSNNLWSQTPPENAQGFGDIIADPMLVNPNAPVVANQVMSEWYKIQSNSPAADNATSLGIEDDYFGVSRTDQPDIGAHELLK